MLHKYYHIIVLILCGSSFAACNKEYKANTAFYYWKTAFELNGEQEKLLGQTGNKVYLRFFDIKWDRRSRQAHPEAVVQFNTNLNGVKVIPVIFITNQTFSNLSLAGADSLAVNSYKLLSTLKVKHHIIAKQLQIDCDWSLSTRDNYFAYLKKLKKLSGWVIAATIRLHQVKYKTNTGVPPVDTGILMFYNMGKLQAFDKGTSSIFSPADAAKYLPYLSSYPLPTDVALPLFSWVIHSREGKILNLYQNLTRDLLYNSSNFDLVNGIYRARKSFFMSGIYIKQNDNFKPEVTDLKVLQNAAEQLSAALPPQLKRTVIYYELANINATEFTAKDILKVSAHF